MPSACCSRRAQDMSSSLASVGSSELPEPCSCWKTAKSARTPSTSRREQRNVHVQSTGIPPPPPGGEKATAHGWVDMNSSRGDEFVACSAGAAESSPFEELIAFTHTHESEETFAIPANCPPHTPLSDLPNGVSEDLIRCTARLECCLACKIIKYDKSPEAVNGSRTGAESSALKLNKEIMN